VRRRRNYSRVRSLAVAAIRKTAIRSCGGGSWRNKGRSGSLIDPQELPLDEMSLASKVPMPASPSWRDLWTYQKETRPIFHTIPDYRAAEYFSKWLASPRPPYQTEEFMSDPCPLELEAFTWESDRSWVPPLDQVKIFTKILGYICDREPQRLPEKPFCTRPCVASEPEEVGKWVLPEGIDSLGQYNSAKTTLTLFSESPVTSVSPVAERRSPGSKIAERQPYWTECAGWRQ
jgi:hypothetical protein